MVEQISTLLPTGSTCRSRWKCPDGCFNPWKAHKGVGFWQELCPVERTPHRSGISGRICDPMLEQSVPGGLYPVESTHAGTVLEELQTMGRTNVEEVNETLYPLGRTP